MPEARIEGGTRKKNEFVVRFVADVLVSDWTRWDGKMMLIRRRRMAVQRGAAQSAKRPSCRPQCRSSYFGDWAVLGRRMRLRSMYCVRRVRRRGHSTVSVWTFVFVVVMRVPQLAERWREKPVCWSLAGARVKQLDGIGWD